MKVALVFPRFHYRSGDPPLGVGYLASMLRNQPGVSVDILDTTFRIVPTRRLARDFQRKKYDIVGISVMSSMVTAGGKVAALAKRFRKDTRVIMGGPHPTMMPEQILADPNVDAVCIGEAETTFPQILTKFPEQDGIRGLAFKQDGSIVKNEPFQPIQNLDSLPMPAWERLPMRAYLRNWFQLDSVSRSSPGTSILASRGCPYRCTFCQPALHKIFGHKLRKRSGQNVAEEVASLVSNYGLKAFMFQDDTFTIDAEWARSVAREVHRRNPGVIWGCNVRTDCVEEDLLRELYACGLRKINLGIESASQRILDEVYHKEITVDQARHAVQLAKELGLAVQGYFMLGAPTETFEEVYKTIEFACELPLDDATFSITTPLPGTFLYDETKGMIRPGSQDYNYYGIPVYETKEVLPAAELKRLKRHAYLRFYLSPKRRGSITRHLFLVGSPGKAINKLRRVF